MTCANEGTFLELLWGHQWTAGTCESDRELGESGVDPQPALIAFNSKCSRCSSRLQLVITRALALHKASFTSSQNPDHTAYFRRAGTTMRRTGIDEYYFGYGDEKDGQCGVCGYIDGVLDVGQARICTVCWGFLKPWLNVVANPRAELVDAEPDTAQDTQMKVQLAHLAGVIEAKLRTDPTLAAEMSEADQLLRDGYPVDLAELKARLDAIPMNVPTPVFVVVGGVSESQRCESCGSLKSECPYGGQLCHLHGDCGCIECRYSPPEHLT